MNKHKYIYIVFALFLTMSALAGTTSVYNDYSLLLRKNKKESEMKADSVMELVISSAMKYEKVLSSYEAEIYVKGRAEILKRNKLIHFAHRVFPVDRKAPDMVFEMISNSTFEAPNIYFHDFKAINGNKIPNKKKQEEFMHFLNLNVYAPTAYSEGVIMPLAKTAEQFYTFDLIDVEEVKGYKVYRIRCLPKQWSQKLISGDLYVVDKLWTIDRIDFSGRHSFADYSVQMTFGRDNRRFILPNEATLTIRYKLLGNWVSSSYYAQFDYKSVEWIEEDNEPRRRTLMNLSNYYNLSTDTVPIVTDTAYWNKKRTVPLTPREIRLYEEKIEVQKKDTTDEQRFIQMTEKLTNSIKFNSKTMYLRYSGLFNPFQFGYSKRNGVSYRQKIRLTKTFKDDTQIRFVPEVGYLFKRKELYFKVSTDWEYWPAKMGVFTLSGGNDNNGYSSEIMDDINEMLKDSIFNFDDINLQYFRHYFVDLKHRMELIHGLQFTAGISYHRRLPVKNKNRIDEDADDDITDVLKKRFNDFTPLVRLSYNPKQYYRKDGKRKIYVYSFHPTISIEYARGIPGVLGSTGNYSRIEGDIHQSISLGLLRRFNYRASAGLYTMHRSTYFADFEYFRRRNFPESWSDQIGGVFNQLNRDWYNASDRYLQAHFMYQSPFIISRMFNMQKATSYILSERFYWSFLNTPVLPFYSEVGYGIGNHIFNVGIFAGFQKFSFDGIGVKFAFELSSN